MFCFFPFSLALTLFLFPSCWHFGGCVRKVAAQFTVTNGAMVYSSLIIFTHGVCILNWTGNYIFLTIVCWFPCALSVCIRIFSNWVRLWARLVIYGHLFIYYFSVCSFSSIEIIKWNPNPNRKMNNNNNKIIFFLEWCNQIV